MEKTPYQNLMLDKQVMKTKKKPVGHMSFLPQELVWGEVWNGGLQRRHNYKSPYPWKKMQLTIHPNEWVQYTS
jgi:hypothetical protein